MSLNKRYDFVLLLDVKDGNPNGDPDAGNLPRLDAETGHGLITDVSLKRKIRNFVAIKHDQTQRDPEPGEKRFEIYVREKAILNVEHQRAYSALKLDVAESPATGETAKDETSEKKGGKDKKRKGSGDSVGKARDWMCQNFYDVRTFGAVKGKIGEVTALSASGMLITAQGGQVEVAKGKLGSGKKVSSADLGIAVGTILGS